MKAHIALIVVLMNSNVYGMQLIQPAKAKGYHINDNQLDDYLKKAPRALKMELIDRQLVKFVLQQNQTPEIGNQFYEQVNNNPLSYKTLENQDSKQWSICYPCLLSLIVPINLYERKHNLLIELIATKIKNNTQEPTRSTSAHYALYGEEHIAVEYKEQTGKLSKFITYRLDDRDTNKVFLTAHFYDKDALNRILQKIAEQKNKNK